MPTKTVPSLTPYGVVSSTYRQRLDDDFDVSWRERLVALVWEKYNSFSQRETPIAVKLAHQCTEACAQTVMFSPIESPHSYNVPTEAEIRCMSATVQWMLGTHVGRSFVRECLAAADELEKIPLPEREAAMQKAVKKFVC